MGKMGASRGWHWVGQALSLARRWPTVFPLMGLIVGGIALIPWIGGMVLLFLGPSLIAGTILAAQRADAGHQPAVGDLFARFRDGERLGPTLTLCLPTVAGQFVGGLVGGIALLSAMRSHGIDIHDLESDPQKFVSALGPSLLGWGALAMVIMLVAYAFLFTSIARVALDKQEAMPSMGESARQAARHPAAWLVMMLTLLLCMFVPACIGLLVRLPLLASLLVYTVLYTVLGPTLYFAWRDLFGGSPERGTKPSPPSGPPPSFEA